MEFKFSWNEILVFLESLPGSVCSRVGDAKGNICSVLGSVRNYAAQLRKFRTYGQQVRTALRKYI